MPDRTDPPRDGEAELRRHLTADHRVDPDRLPPTSALEGFHNELHATDHTPAALAGVAQEAFNALYAALTALHAADVSLAEDAAEQWSMKLLRDFGSDGFTGVTIY